MTTTERLAAMALGLTLLTLLNSCEQRKVSAAAPTPLTPVRVHAVSSSDVNPTRRYAATVEPNAQVDLAFRVSGVVESLHQVHGRNAEPGDIIPAGAVLARVRTTEYRARTAQAEAQLADAEALRQAAVAQLQGYEAGLRQAEADYERAEGLVRVQAMTRADFDSVRTRRDTAVSQIAAAKANLASLAARIEAARAAQSDLRVSLSDTSLVAPFTAYVVSRRVERGSLVDASAGPAFTLADLREVKLRFNVPDQALREFPVGSRVTASLDAYPGEPFVGRVTAVSPSADATTHLFRVDATLPNPGARLKAGMVASVLHESKSEPPLMTVPVSALVRFNDQGERFGVMVVQQPGSELRRRAVEVGSAQGNLIAVTRGLEPGELVVSEGVARLHEGERVRVVQ